ncbi:chorismate-binding protein [Persicobacter psychrovividus]|uniref:Chorismate-utilising enzyme C-terminal domain-containing protein n=1 Tax=Persicobacter psychrovividus TaxID=387638 RepID=A0ABN6L982_9BACT|nr:hypothetical protein PEPS_16590 [Persicobacter psychrovividus]
MNKNLCKSTTEVNINISTFENAIAWALNEGYGIACYRLPESACFQLMIDISGKPMRCQEEIEQLPTGFIFSPFDNQEPRDAFYLTAHLMLKSGENEASCNAEEYYPQRDALNQYLQNTAETPPFRYHQPTENSDPAITPRAEFIRLVNEGIEQIENGHFLKFVPSRTKAVSLAQFQLVENLKQMATEYPNAFVSFVSIPDVGSWIGATPEILMHMDQQSVFHTVALAGTQPFPEDGDLKNVAWRQKEIEEQALVSRYIINILKKLRIREFIEKGPKTVKAGNLIHLKTTFEIDTKTISFPDLGNVMLRLLHPTSAVCGMPLEASEQFLKAEEKYDRAFFAGYLGPINAEGESYAFVNLRCMQILGDHAILYAGAGVTADSSPEKEWTETELKCNTVGKIIQTPRESN